MLWGRFSFDEIISSKYEGNNCIKDEERCGCNIWGKVCRILCERILCPAINIFVIFSGLIYVYVVHLFSGRSVNVDSVNDCCACCSKLLFYYSLV